jgi:hypothetical protein
MEKGTNEKIDELAALVKESALAIKENSAAIKENATAIDDLATIVKAGFDQVGKDIADVNHKVDVFHAELKSEISAVRTELKSEISDLRTEVRDGFMKTNDKVDLLTVKLSDKNVITKKDAKEVMAINPVTIS